MTTMTDSKAVEVLADYLHMKLHYSSLNRKAVEGIAREYLTVARLREPAGVDWTHDAEQWGKALNDAAWKFSEHCPEKSALLFNNTKAPLRMAILHYAAKVMEAAPQPPAEAQAQGGGEVVAQFYVSDKMEELCPIADMAPGRIRELLGNGTHDLVARTAPPSAPVGELVSALQSMRDRMMTALPPKFGDAFDGDFDTLLEAINALKGGRRQNLAALAQQPSAAPVGVDHQWVSDQFGFLEGLVNEWTYGSIVSKAVELMALAQQPAADWTVRCAACGYFGDADGEECPQCGSGDLTGYAPQQPAADPDVQYADANALIAHLDGLYDDNGQGGDKWDVAQAAIAGIRAYQQPAAAPFQQRVQPWMLETFGAEIAGDVTERGDRLLEEVLELLQSHGYDPGRVATLREYVFGRPVGEPAQEVGGVMVTLAAYCLATGLDMHAAGEAELSRIWTKVEVIRAKQASKNGLHTPLPTPPQQPAAVDGVMVDRFIRKYQELEPRDDVPAVDDPETRRFAETLLTAALAAQPGGSNNDR